MHHNIDDLISVYVSIVDITELKLLHWVISYKIAQIKYLIAYLPLYYFWTKYSIKVKAILVLCWRKWDFLNKQKPANMLAVQWPFLNVSQQQTYIHAFTGNILAIYSPVQ